MERTSTSSSKKWRNYYEQQDYIIGEGLIDAASIDKATTEEEKHVETDG